MEMIKRRDSIGYRMRVIHNDIHKQMEAKRIENEGDLTGMQRWTMGYIKDHENQTIYQKDIEQEFKVSGATASNMLKLMEKKGLILREPVSHDARLKKISLTPKAQNMVARAQQDVQEMEEKILNGFQKEEIAQLKKYLDRIMDNIGVSDNRFMRPPENGGEREKDHNI